MNLWIIGIVSVAILRTCVPFVAANPFGTSFGNRIAYRPSREQHAEFAEGIRDWFRNMKNRFFGVGSDQQVLPQSDAGTMMMELENEDLQERRENPGFILDLSTLTFDPERDWGFRLGQWYFIRKSKKVLTSEDWETSHPHYPEWQTSEEDKNDDVVPSSVTMNFSDLTTIGTTVAADETSTSTPKDAKNKSPNDEENETHKRSMYDQSAEVYLPEA